MKKSESIIEITKALLEVQKKIKNIEPNATNPYFKSKYADLGHIIDIVRPLIIDAGLTIIQSASSQEIGMITVETMLLHDSGEWVSTEMVLPAKGKDKFDPQTTGSAYTYGRRYALSALFNIATEADDDGNSNSGQSDEKYQPKGAPGRLDFDEVKTELGKMNIEEGQKYYEEIKTKHTMSEKQLFAINKIFKEFKDSKDGGAPTYNIQDEFAF